MTELERKEQWSIDYIRTIEANVNDLHLAYSGGKDSEVLLHLARKAKVPFTAFYKNTTIDPPGTLSYIKHKHNIIIIRPKRDFYTLIRHRGLPSEIRRFCCLFLKEYYVADHVLTGIRREESKKRSQKYSEPEQCFIHKSGRKSHTYMPILYWSNEELAQYIKEENIECHPHYYDNQGHFHCERRLGCLGCPLPYDRSIDEFMRYPRMVRAWCTAAAYYRNTRTTLGTSITNYRDEYEYFYHNLYNRRLAQLIAQQRERPRDFARMHLQKQFGIELPEPQSSLEQLMPVHKFI